MSSLYFLFIRVQSKIRSLARDYQLESPKEKWEIVRRVNNLWLMFLGMSVLDRKFKVNWLSYLTVLLGVDYAILMVHTVHKYISEPLKAIEPTCVFGVILQVIENSNKKIVSN